MSIMDEYISVLQLLGFPNVTQWIHKSVSSVSSVVMHAFLMMPWSTLTKMLVIHAAVTIRGVHAVLAVLVAVDVVVWLAASPVAAAGAKNAVGVIPSA